MVRRPAGALGHDTFEAEFGKVDLRDEGLDDPDEVLSDT